MRDTRTIQNTSAEENERLVEELRYKLAIKLRQISAKCKVCKKTFVKTRTWQEFCCKECKNLYHAEHNAQRVAKLEEELEFYKELYAKAQDRIKDLQTEIQRLQK